MTYLITYLLLCLGCFIPLKSWFDLMLPFIEDQAKEEFGDEYVEIPLWVTYCVLFLLSPYLIIKYYFGGE